MKADRRRKTLGNRCLPSLLVALLVAAGYVATLALAAAEPAPAAASSARSPGRVRALLVGVTDYPALSKDKQLEGPTNDVLLVRKVLTEERYAVSPADVVILSEAESAAATKAKGPAEGAKFRPVAQNIRDQLKRLEHESQPGDTAIVLLSGHGSQQPDVPGDDDDLEPDGLDEIFLPADCGRWTKEAQGVANAIVDDELRRWSQRLLAKGVELWLIVDSCNSGSMMRGQAEIVARDVPADLLVPKAELEAAAKRAELRATAGESKSPSRMLGMSGSRGNPPGTARGETGGSVPAGAKWVALYAADPFDQTIEMKLPRNTKLEEPRPYGILSYALCTALSSSRPPTYRELLQRIQGQYMTWGLNGPHPSLEGTELDRVVLGAEVRPQRFFFTRDAEPGQTKAKPSITVEGGRLHHLTEDSILAVYELPGRRCSRARTFNGGDG
jgi:hypothetical protein